MSSRKEYKTCLYPLSHPFVEIVSLPFNRLKHLCRFEKGGYCEQAKKDAKLKTALKSKSKNKNRFTPFSGQAVHLEDSKAIAGV